MARFKQILFITLLTILFVEVLIVFPKYIEEHSEVKKIDAQDLKSGADQTMEGIHLVESTAGERDWELFSEKAEANSDTGEWSMKRVKVIFYSPENVTFSVFADHGQIDTKTKNMVFSGNVKTISSNGYQIESQLIQYNSQEKFLKSPSQIKIKGPKKQGAEGLRVSGGNLSCDLKTSEFKISKNIIATEYYKDKSVLVSSGEAFFSGKDDRVEFKQNVILKLGALEIKGPVAQFQYDKNNKTLKGLKLEGGVQAMDKDRLVTSNQLDIDLSQDKYAFKGSPKVVQNNDELFGEEIILFDGGKKMKVERIRANVDDISTGRN